MYYETKQIKHTHSTNKTKEIPNQIEHKNTHQPTKQNRTEKYKHCAIGERKCLVQVLSIRSAKANQTKVKTTKRRIKRHAKKKNLSRKKTTSTLATYACLYSTRSTSIG